jgi:hypothetical protein
LIKLYDLQDNLKIVGKMKDIVPEFVSQNSVFESLDYINASDSLKSNA